jgi:hypothetical protein
MSEEEAEHHWAYLSLKKLDGYASLFEPGRSVPGRPDAFLLVGEPEELVPGFNLSVSHEDDSINIELRTDGTALKSAPDTQLWHSTTVSLDRDQIQRLRDFLNFALTT